MVKQRHRKALHSVIPRTSRGITMAISSLPSDVSIVGGNSVASDKGGGVEQKS
jgi:hypothetical protein